MSRIRRFGWVVVAVTVGACADARPPLAPESAEVGALAAAQSPSSSSGSGDPAAYVLRQASYAPPLERYTASFWAVKGEDRSIEIRYRESLSGFPNRPFLKFTVYGTALDRDAKGKRLRDGDSLLISLAIDPGTFRVDFEPSGLAFSGRRLPALRLSYTFADLDVDRDGDFDTTDVTILERATAFYHYADARSGWTAQPTMRNNFERFLEVTVPGFSGYAVSW